MYLAKIRIQNFRRLKDLTIEFIPGLNVIVGENNTGKSAVVDAIRSLVPDPGETFLRLSEDDVHKPEEGAPACSIDFELEFAGLSLEEEADLLDALVKEPNETGFRARFMVEYSQRTSSDHLLTVRRTCGEHGVPVNSQLLENLRMVYLPPLRDAARALRPGRGSRLAHLVRLLTLDENREGIEESLSKNKKDVEALAPVIESTKAIRRRHLEMLGQDFKQEIALDFTTTEWNRLLTRLTMLVEDKDVRQNGLGYNNLIYMAVVLSEMNATRLASFRAMIVEEPEAHLHPQLQAVLLEYLLAESSIPGRASTEDSTAAADDEAGARENDDVKGIQVFVTSHSPSFTALAPIDALIYMTVKDNRVVARYPRNATFATESVKNRTMRRKLQRYLDVTRAELFFARGIILVEGTAEALLIHELAKKMTPPCDLRKRGVSVISTAGLNFDVFMPLFGEGEAAIPIPVSVITDSDPPDIRESENSEKSRVYPAADEQVTLSETASRLKKLGNHLVKVYTGQRTFEYDLALEPANHNAMLAAFEELHPTKAKTVRTQVDEAVTPRDKAVALFEGAFGARGKAATAKKGAFAQALAEVLSVQNAPCGVPAYISAAIQHVCRISSAPKENSVE